LSVVVAAVVPSMAVVVAREPFGRVPSLLLQVKRQLSRSGPVVLAAGRLPQGTAIKETTEETQSYPLGVTPRQRAAAVVVERAVTPRPHGQVSLADPVVAMRMATPLTPLTRLGVRMAKEQAIEEAMPTTRAARTWAVVAAALALALWAVRRAAPSVGQVAMDRQLPS